MPTALDLLNELRALPTRNFQRGYFEEAHRITGQYLVERCKLFRKHDPQTRPILLNLGQGVANDEWYGRGPGAKPDDYLTYVKGCDIVSFEYPRRVRPRGTSGVVGKITPTKF